MIAGCAERDAGRDGTRPSRERPRQPVHSAIGGRAESPRTLAADLASGINVAASALAVSFFLP